MIRDIGSSLILRLQFSNVEEAQEIEDKLKSYDFDVNLQACMDEPVVYREWHIADDCLSCSISQFTAFFESVLKPHMGE